MFNVSEDIPHHECRIRIFNASENRKLSKDMSSFIALVDLTVMFLIFATLLLRNRGTRCAKILKGILAVFTIQSLTQTTNLSMVATFLDTFTSSGAIAGIVIFQPELRSFLEQIGRQFAFKTKMEHVDSNLLSSIEKAVHYLSKRKIGALITLERGACLENYVETGIKLNAEVTGELLINIFIPNTPLHDGAVIMRGGKIVAASAYLPLSESREVPAEFGTRHRAALGMSEQTDALTIVVSEETGEISITFENKLLPNLTRDQFLDIITRELTWL